MKLPHNFSTFNTLLENRLNDSKHYPIVAFSDIISKNII